MSKAAVELLVTDLPTSFYPTQSYCTSFEEAQLQKKANLETHLGSKVAQRDLTTCFQVHSNLNVLPSFADAQLRKLLFVGLNGAQNYLKMDC